MVVRVNQGAILGGETQPREIGSWLAQRAKVPRLSCSSSLARSMAHGVGRR